ncbi:MAG TPA: amidohydrolase family protein, partial [Acidimicrobiales bacterium]|nr:amidohydrolase family protein [Acidimicrobiales bacterium]
MTEVTSEVSARASTASSNGHAPLPPIVSVDDHVVEPAGVWQDRLPAKYREVGPRVVRAPMGEITFVGGKLTVEPGSEGHPTDWWHYEDLRRPLLRLDAAVGVPREEVTITGVTYEDMRPGAYQVGPRLEDMDINHLEASLCFPTFPRFCGQTFTEAKDKDLGLLCVRAYNDWMVDEWCAQSGGRLIPLCLIPLWDAGLAAAEVRRNAERGVRAVCFSEIPPFLGLPSVHDPDNYWDPFFRACAETGTVVNMHIGSSSKMPSTSEDAPPAVGSTLTHTNATFSVVDFLFSGVLVRFPTLKLA